MKNVFLAGVLIFLFSLVSCDGEGGQKKIVILSTNDTHSRIESLSGKEKKYPNTAGVLRRAEFIEQIRKENPNVLLFDVGDFVQGTPYFNVFFGKTETATMNLLKYDAGTLGNHEFDFGLDTLKRMVQELKYPIVNCNYDFSNTVLKGLIKPYVVLEREGVRIGVLGVGPDPKGLIQASKYEGMVFNSIIESANKTAKILKEKEQCDFILCLSHIGYTAHNKGDVVDTVLVAESENIDMILGGHSHTYMEKPNYVKNKIGKDVMIFQAGKNGSFVNRVEVTFE